MAWTVRTVFKKPGGDPLFEFLTTYPHASKMMFQDPALVSMAFFKSQDKSIGYVLLTWQSKEAYDSWKALHSSEIESSELESTSWALDRGITIVREQPEAENQLWQEPQYMIDGVRAYNQYSLEQIIAGE